MAFSITWICNSYFLSYRVPPIFVGIAYDSGGVASGPMTATFILAFAQGAANAMPTANVLIDGFGVIAMVAMTPLVAIQILGLLFKIKAKRGGVSISMNLIDKEYSLFCIIVDFGKGNKVLEKSKELGATGGELFFLRKRNCKQ